MPDDDVKLPEPTDEPEDAPSPDAEAADAAKVRKLNRKEIEEVVDATVIRGNVRAQDVVYSVVAKHFNVAPASARAVRKVVEEQYLKIVKRVLGALILTQFREGVEDFKTIMLRARKEKYTIDDAALMELIREQKKVYRDAAGQGIRDRMQTDPLAGEASVERQRREAAVAEYKRGLRTSVGDNMSQYKARFLQMLVKQYHLTFARETEQEHKLVVLHQGSYFGREIKVKTTFADNTVRQVENVVLLFRRESGHEKKTVAFDVRQMHEKWSGENGQVICKKSLLALNKVMGFKDFPSLPWLLQNVLINAEDMPAGVEEFLRKWFFPHLQKVELEVTEEYLTEFVNKKYYGGTQGM